MELVAPRNPFGTGGIVVMVRGIPIHRLSPGSAPSFPARYGKRAASLFGSANRKAAANSLPA
jgi:hypothetical protein